MLRNCVHAYHDASAPAVLHGQPGKSAEVVVSSSTGPPLQSSGRRYPPTITYMVRTLQTTWSLFHLILPLPDTLSSKMNSSFCLRMLMA